MRKFTLSLVAFTFFVFSAPLITEVAAQVRPYRVSDRTVQSLLTRIESRSDTFRRTMNSALDQSRYNSTRREDAIFDFITEFENATDSLKQRFDARQSVIGDVENVLGRANYIEDFMKRNRLTASAQSQWRYLSIDLNTLAQYYNVRWNRTLGYYFPSVPGGQTGALPYTSTDSELQSLLNRIEVRTDDYRRVLSNALDRSTLNGTSREDEINRYVTDFENATDSLKRKFESRSSITADAQEVLGRAGFIDSFMRNNQFGNNVRNQWNLLKTDLNTLSRYYNVAWDWNNPNWTPGNNYPGNTYPGNNYPSTGYGILTGTYQLNRGLSDNVTAVIDRAVSNNVYNTNQSDRIRRNLERRLASPEMIAIDYVNPQFTVASSNSPQVTIMTDGVGRSETNPNGRTVTTKAETTGNAVNISYEGDRVNDFYLTFTPLSNNQLRVTRRIYLENRNETVIVNSVYDRVSQAAQWSSVNRTASTGTYPGGQSSADFVVPNGTRLIATLNTPISTKTAANGQPFSMTVNSPSEFQGATIEGTVAQSDRSGRVSGRAEILLNFDTIRLRDGRSYRFSGLVDSVRNANGDTVNINNEGVVRDNNQTTKTVTRAGIGAALGALIGAIAGGGQGAAIGAAIGAGAGAGSVILQGRDDLELGTGTEFNLTSSAPANMRSNY